MTTLFNKYLCEREFGSAVLHVETFQKWAVAKGLHLRTAPALGEYEFAQVESLLCAIERGAAPQTTEDARAIIDSKPELAGHTVAVRFPEPDHSHVWLVGADAHLQWRKLIEQAIGACELQLLDGASYLPVSSRLAASSGAPESAEPPWKTEAVMLGNKYIKAWRDEGYEPTGADAALYIEGEFSTLGIYGKHKEVLDAAYIYRHALTGITGNKPGHKSKKPKIPEGKRGHLPEFK